MPGRLEQRPSVARSHFIGPALCHLRKNRRTRQHPRESLCAAFSVSTASGFGPARAGTPMHRAQANDGRAAARGALGAQPTPANTRPGARARPSQYAQVAVRKQKTGRPRSEQTPRATRRTRRAPPQRNSHRDVPGQLPWSAHRSDTLRVRPAGGHSMIGPCGWPTPDEAPPRGSETSGSAEASAIPSPAPTSPRPAARPRDEPKRANCKPNGCPCPSNWSAWMRRTYLAQRAIG